MLRSGLVGRAATYHEVVASHIARRIPQMNPPDTDVTDGSPTAPVQEISIDTLAPGAVREVPIALPEGGWAIEQVVEKAGSGGPDSSLIWQFDAHEENEGTLIVVGPAGQTPSSRTIQIRFVEDDQGGDRTSSPREDDPIAVDPDASDEAQDAYEIRTPTASYFYQKTGGGFSSLVDRDGNDWISYRPGNGPAGEYRGIPNMVFRSDGGRNNHFHPGHKKHKASTARLVHSGPLKVTIESSVDETRWRVRWEIFPNLARLTVLDIDHDDPRFWFLYEGTPGGSFELKDQCLRSNGVDSPLSEKWEDRTDAIAWVAFRVPEQNRSLLLRLETEVDVPVSYYPMAPMTVFGFGRKLGSVENFLSTAPTQITVRFLETSDPEEIEALAASE